MPIRFDKKKEKYIVRIFSFNRNRKVGEFDTYEEAKEAESDPPLSQFETKSRRARVVIPGITPHKVSPYQGWSPAMFASESKKQVAEFSKKYAPGKKE